MYCGYNIVNCIFSLISVRRVDFVSEAKKTKLSFSELFGESVKALTRKNMGVLVFEYQVKISGDELIFTWKKDVSSAGLKVSPHNMNVHLYIK